jgi:hypothetical protein
MCFVFLSVVALSICVFRIWTLDVCLGFVSHFCMDVDPAWGFVTHN